MFEIDFKNLGLLNFEEVSTLIDAGVSVLVKETTEGLYQVIGPLVSFNSHVSLKETMHLAQFFNIQVTTAGIVISKRGNTYEIQGTVQS